MLLLKVYRSQLSASPIALFPKYKIVVVLLFVVVVVVDVDDDDVVVVVAIVVDSVIVVSQMFLALGSPTVWSHSSRNVVWAACWYDLLILGY